MTSSGVNLHSGDTMAVHLAYDGATLTMTITDTATTASFTASKVINIPGNRRRECRLRRLHCRYR